MTKFVKIRTVAEYSNTPDGWAVIRPSAIESVSYEKSEKVWTVDTSLTSFLVDRDTARRVLEAMGADDVGDLAEMEK